MSDCIWVNMTTQKTEMLDLPKKYETLGGRALTSQMCADEIDPTCYPLGDKNKLIIAPGLLSQHDHSLAGRVTIGGKSPLNQGITASNGGGISGGRLGLDGLRAIVAEGLPRKENLYILVIERDTARLVSADDLRGKGVYQTVLELQQKYGRDTAISCIGPAGEMLMPTAAIANAGIDGKGNRFCGRGGLGAVMGSKRLKAVVISNAAAGMDSRQKDKQKQASVHFTELLKKDVRFAEEIRSSQGMPWSVTVNAVNSTTKETAAVKPGTVQAFKSFCGIQEIQALAKLNDYINDLGMDTLETAAALGVLMEAEVIEWGDSRAALNLLEEVRAGTSLGHVIGQGSRIAAEAYGLSQSKHLQEGFSTQHALLPENHLKPDTSGRFCITAALQSEQAEEYFGSRDNEVDPGHDLYAVTNCLLDTLGLSLYLAPLFLHNPELRDEAAEAVNAYYGWKLNTEDLVTISRQTIKNEREFNKSAGYGGEVNRLGGLYIKEWRPRYYHYYPVVMGDNYLRR